MTPFSVQLRIAMTRRRVMSKDLAAQVGLGKATMTNLRSGKATPTIRAAEKLADALEWPSLRDIAIAARSLTCALCDAPFIIGSTSKRTGRRYCGVRCAQAAHARIERDRTRVKTLTETRMTRQRLADHQEAVGMFCRNVCEPEGLMCPDASCPLSRVTPLPLARRNAA